MKKVLAAVLLLMGPVMAWAEEGDQEFSEDCREEAMNSGIIDPNEMRDYIDQCIEDYRAQKESSDEEMSTTYPDDM